MTAVDTPSADTRTPDPTDEDRPAEDRAADGPPEGPTDGPATAPRDPQGRSGRLGVAALLAHGLPWALLLAAAVVVLRDVSLAPVRIPAGLVLLPGLPVLVLSRRLGWSPSLAGVGAVVLSSGLAVLGTIVGGLALNTVGPWLGEDRPLAPAPVSLAVVVADAALLLWRIDRPLVPVETLRRVHVGDAARRLAGLRCRPLPTLVVVTLALTVVGAVRLNNGAGGAVAVLARLGVAALLVLALASRREDLRRDAVVVYVSSLSLLLATSLRSWYVSGHDVQREFISFQVTAHADRWRMDLYPSPYHACLSVNILPVLWSDLTGLTGTVMFKVVLQVVAALVPVAVLLVGRRMIGPRLGLVSALVFVGFPTLDNDLPFLVRQEIAFLFLALAFVAALAVDVPARRRRLLATLFGLGVVLSHYSTTYLLITSLVVGLAAMAGLRWLQQRRARRAPGVTLPPPAWREALTDHGLLHPLVLGALLLATVVWVYPVTHSGGHLADTLRQSASNLIHGRGGPGSTDEAYSILPGGGTTTPQERIRLFNTDNLQVRADHPTAPFLLPDSAVRTPPRIVDIPPSPLTWLGRALDHVVPVETATKLSRAGIAALLQALVLVGVAILLLRRWWGAHQLSLEATLLPLGAVGGVALVVLVPGLSSDYGVLRAFCQALLILAPVVVIAAATLLHATGRLARRLGGRARRARPDHSPDRRPGRGVYAVLAVSVVGMYLVLTSVVSTLTGGYDGQLALANDGVYHQFHYVTDGEADGYHWLGENAGGRIVQSEVISDKLAAQRYAADPDQGVLVAGDLYPAQLLQGTVVFLGPDTVHHGTAGEFYTGSLLNYRFPTSKVAQRLDLVFSDPDAQVYW